MDKKRAREEENEEAGEKKRLLHGLTAEGKELLNLLEQDDEDADSNEDSENAVNGVMKSLEEEISTIRSSPSDISPASDGSDGLQHIVSSVSVSTDGDCQVDLGYLLEATDDELGIPPSAGEDDSTTGTSRCPQEDESDVGLLETDSPVAAGHLAALWQMEEEEIFLPSSYDMWGLGLACDDTAKVADVDGRDQQIYINEFLYAV